MRKNWKRWIAGLLTAVMLVTMLPTAAYAALLDNTPDQNRQILEELTAFWGDEKTAQEAMELLRQYGLIDEEGNRFVEPGTYTIYIGGQQPDPRSAALTGKSVASLTVTLTGDKVTLEN